jgi:outer membrane immunogenic protein
MYRHNGFAVRVAALLVTAAATLLLSESATFAQCAPAGASSSGSGSSWVTGAQAGYNWQSGALVYGLETDLSGTDLKDSMSGLTTPCAGASASTTAKVDWYGTVRGRAGYAMNQMLFYATGGLAYGHVDLSSTFTGFGLTLNTDNSSVRTGWVAGVGVDYMLQPNLIFNLGYQYVDLGTASLAATTSGGGNFITQTASAHAAFSVVTAGLIWRFAPGQGSWGGAYAGAHAGGDWGLTSNATYTSGPIVSDRRLKRDVTVVAVLDSGLRLYRYRYLWSDTVYVGVMAQEVALIRPDAVVQGKLDDYLRVDYRRLGLHMMTLPEWQALNKGAAL